ncbi:MAG: DinB family protein [Pyrinomonadaceae bacterium]
MSEENHGDDTARSVLRALWEHHWWSFDQFLEAASALSDEEFKRDLGISYASLHGALAHLIGAELVWLKRVAQGESMTHVPGVDELPDLEAVKEAWQRSKSGWRQALEQDDLRREIHYSNTKGQTFSDPVWRVMTHLVDHSATYRGILIAGLRLLGHAPPATGVIFYTRQQQKSL